MIKNLIIVALLVLLVVVVVMNMQTKATSLPNIQNQNKTSNVSTTTKVVVEPQKINGLVLDLSHKGLTAVPKQTFSQVDITTLNLSDNALSGALPGEVRLLKKLEVLNLSHNNFTGVPAEIGQLTMLRVLDLSGNPITGLPNELGNLSKLERLDLSGTKYSKVDLDGIRQRLPSGVVIVTD